MIDIIARKTCPGWSAAEEHLSEVEPKLAQVIARVGPCTIAPRTDYFASLCRAIISQQISTPVARTIIRRFDLLFPRSRCAPPDCPVRRSRPCEASPRRSKRGKCRPAAFAR
jgi:hypothetical protein